MTKQNDGCLCFDNEKTYNEFVAELHGKISPERKLRLDQTKRLIQKYGHLLDDFEVKNN